MTRLEEQQRQPFQLAPLLSIATLAGLAGYAQWLAARIGDPWWTTYIWRTCAALGAAVAASDLSLLGAYTSRTRAFVRGFSLGASVVLIVAGPILLAIPEFPMLLNKLVSRGDPLLLLVLLEGLARPQYFLLIVGSRVVLIRSLLAARTSGDEDASWYRGVALSPSVLLVAFSPALASAYVNWHPNPAPASVAVAAARDVIRCAEAYAADHSGRFPQDLEQLARESPSCLGPGLADGRVGEWSVRFNGGGGPRLTIRERMAPLRTYRSFFSDASGVLYTAGYESRDAQPSDNAVGAVAQNLHTVGFCMNRLSGQLPATLWGLSARRSSCTAFSAAVWLGDGDSTVAEFRTKIHDRASSTSESYRYEYHPWLNGAGRVDSADVSARPAVYGRTGVASYVLAWKGEIHATAANRAAARDDPVVGGCDVYSTAHCAPELWVDADASPRETARLMNSAPAWQVQIGTPRADRVFDPIPLPPVVGNDHSVIITSPDGTYAYDADGKKLWGRPDVVSKSGGLARGEGATILVVDSSGVLHALAQQGADVWRVVLGQQAKFAPVRSRDMIYVLSDSTLYGVSARGELRWARQLSGTSFEAAAADDGGVYVHRVDQLEHYSERGDRDASAAFDSLQPCAGDPATDAAPSLSACGADGFRASLWPSGERRFMRIPDETGPPMQRDQLVSTSEIHDDGTVVASQSRPIRAIGPNMATRWRLPGNATDVYFAPVVIHDYSACIVSGHRLGWIDQNGVEFAATELGRARYSELAADPAGVVYLLRDDGTLYAVRLPATAATSR